MSKWQKPPTINPVTDAYQNTMGVTVYTDFAVKIPPGHWWVVPGSVWADADFRASFKPVPDAPKREGCLGCAWGKYYSPTCPDCKSRNG